MKDERPIGTLEIEVVKTNGGGHVRRRLLTPAGPLTIREALRAAGEDVNENAPPPIGVFGRTATLDDRLVGGERIELYRALLADPKQARRGRARRSQLPLRG